LVITEFDTSKNWWYLSKNDILLILNYYTQSSNDNIQIIRKEKLVSMKHKCPCGSCQKEFDNPIWVTNFSIGENKVTYYACPYCLTKIEIVKEEPSYQPVINLHGDAATPENERDEQLDLRTGRLEKLEALKKQKRKLLEEIENLRTAATEKLDTLEEEVAALREEAQILKEMIK
jgi:DNA-directed RNA polymerase subunit RPC12/RpoP